MRKIAILNLVAFLAAFLLFQIELIISKILLPQYGGSYLVWGACVVFFQAALFLGYLYSHIVVRKIGIKQYLPFHLAILLLPLLLFPGRGLPEINYVNWSMPLVLSVFWQLAWTIGPVFFVLSTSSVILQVWLADSDLPEKNNPYFIYALSNLGSFAALISYPLFFELFFDLNQQIIIWRVIYFLIILLNAAALLVIKATSRRTEAEAGVNLRQVTIQDCLRWLLFSAAGVIMFLSVTNTITYEVAPIPLLWVIPLCIYLVAFVLNFKQRPWCPDWILNKFYLTVAWSIVLFFITSKIRLPFIFLAVVYCIFLFFICMFCQFNLNKNKPRDLRNLPLFYLVISFGGFIGGLVTTWIMPVVSVLLLEYLLGLTVIALALALGTKRESLGWLNIRMILYTIMVLMLWPLEFSKYNILGLIFIFWIFKACYANLAKNPRAFFCGILLILCVAPFINYLWRDENYVYRSRNYYGIYKVYYKNGKMFLLHGNTIHGAQYADKQREQTALTYYHPHTPVGELLSSSSIRLEKIGVIGLGTGALASYIRESQEFDYFEIDPDVYFIAHDLFRYMNKPNQKINFIFGDARLEIKKAQPKRYDLLVVDAFSGDSIPAHLLTIEAINEYRRHLKDEGIILFHISNRYLDLVPVLFSNANYVNAYSCVKSNKLEGDNVASASDWFALTWNLKTLDKLVTELKWANLDPAKCAKAISRPWTDKYSNLFLIMKFDAFLDSIKYFQPFYW